MKRMISLSLSAVLGSLLVLSACSSGGSSGGTASPVAGTGANPSSGPSEAPKIDYPTRAIDYIVPFSPGGGVDLVARAVAESLSKEWGQPINVINKAGAGGATGAQFALKQSPADGYTVLAVNVSNTSMLTAGYVEPPVKLEDHKLVSRVVQDVPAFVVKADAPWKDFKEFSDWVKANPDKLTWTSVGPSGFSSFVVAEWLGEIGADFSKTRMVTTKGASESLPIVAGGNAVLAVHTVNEVASLVKANKLKVLAVQAPARSPFFPDVPTVEEQGVKNLKAIWWTGVTMPKNTPDAIAKKWEEALAKLSKDPAFIGKLKNLQLEPGYLNAKDFGDFLKQETDYYVKLGTEKGIRK